MEVDDESLSSTDQDSTEEQEDYISLTEINSDSDGDLILIGSEENSQADKVHVIINGCDVKFDLRKDTWME